ncbi:MAG: hypothetical protein QHH15_06195, partial [Candidatus Thermoplasmatota archaeon]|nr:hypothetical protein [Candidatus Thermoplasmatota archaeon]
MVLGILIISSIGAVATQNENINFEQITVSFSQPIIKNENQYITISVDEANSFLMEQNKPMIPSYEKTFYYPFKTKIKSVTITPKNIQEKPLTNKVQPTPKMLQVGQK